MKQNYNQFFNKIKLKQFGQIKQSKNLAKIKIIKDNENIIKM